jgi:hypothetical protein
MRDDDPHSETEPLLLPRLWILLLLLVAGQVLLVAYRVPYAVSAVAVLEYGDPGTVNRVVVLTRRTDPPPIGGASVRITLPGATGTVDATVTSREPTLAPPEAARTHLGFFPVISGVRADTVYVSRAAVRPDSGVDLSQLLRQPLAATVDAGSRNLLATLLGS